MVLDLVRRLLAMVLDFGHCVLAGLLDFFGSLLGRLLEVVGERASLLLDGGGCFAQLRFDLTDDSLLLAGLGEQAADQPTRADRDRTRGHRVATGLTTHRVRCMMDGVGRGRRGITHPFTEARIGVNRAVRPRRATTRSTVVGFVVTEHRILPIGETPLDAVLAASDYMGRVDPVLDLVDGAGDLTPLTVDPELWGQLVWDDFRRAGLPSISANGDAAVRRAAELYFANSPEGTRDDYLDRLATRLTIGREWSRFFDAHPVLLTANSWERQFAVDDDQRSAERMGEILRAQSPLLGTAMLGLPGLSVPVGVRDGLPTGVQLVASRFREDFLVEVGQLIEDRAGFDVLEHLTPHDTTN